MFFLHAESLTDFTNPDICDVRKGDLPAERSERKAASHYFRTTRVVTRGYLPQAANCSYTRDS